MPLRRLFLICFALFFIAIVGLIWVLNIAGIIKGFSSYLLGAVFGILGALFAFLQWALPLSPITSTTNTEPRRPVASLISGSRRRYCDFLIYEHRNFDVKGLSTQGIFALDLEQVFVELSIVPKPPHRTSADPIQVAESLQEAGHPIWDYLASELLKNQHLVIIGAPGSGKTTLLKHMTLSLVTRKRQLHDPKIPHKLPILLFLRNHVDSLKDKPDFSLVDAVQDSLKKWSRTVPPEWVEQQLARGHCFILLDGLDEVADPEVRHKVVNWVQQQMVAYGKNRFIITSRPFGYISNPLSGVTVLEVRPFTPEQVKQFIHNWYLANEIMSSLRDDPGVRIQAKDGAEDLLRRLRSTPALFALAVNPLLLTMIATVHRYRSSLPGKRVALYAEICEVFLGKRQESKSLALELSPAQKQWVLQSLAYHLMCKGAREITLAEAQPVIEEPLARVNPQISTKEFLQMVENASGLLLEREHEVFGFAHLTIQEYLAATYVRENKLEQDLVARVEANWWHETIRLYCAQADATPIIAACLVSDRPSVASLTLALECQKEAFQLQSVVSAQLDALVDQGMDDTDPERQRIVTEALLARRLRHMVHLNRETYADTSLVTSAEYQLFLDERRVRGMCHRPDHWADDHFPLGRGQAPILGVRASDAAAFCTWLTEREPGAWLYRLPHADESERIVTTKLIAGTGYWLNVSEGFVWARGGPLLADNTPKERLDQHYEHDFFFAHDIGIDLTRVINLADDLARIIDRPHARILVRDLDQKLARAYELAQIRAYDVAHTRAYDLEVYYNFSRELDHARAIAIDRACAIAIDRAYDFTRELASDHDLVHALGLDHLGMFKISYHIPDRRFEREEVSAFLRWYIRFFAYALGTDLMYQLQIKSSPRTKIEQLFHSSSVRKPESDEIQHIIDRCLSMYVNFAILEERVQGTLPAREGILIVKERRGENNL